MRGKLIAVVGPSGVGKDTLLDGARARLEGLPHFHFVRRIITRPADAGGEDHEAVTPDAFARRLAAGDLLIHWQAHGLSYGLPADITERLEQGENVIVNTSRGQIGPLAQIVRDIHAITVDAPAAVVAARLRARGRESEAEIAARKARVGAEPVAGVTYATVWNDGTVEEGIAKFVDVLLGAAHLPLRLRRAALDVWREPFCILNSASHAVRAANLGDAQMVEVTADGGLSARARLALTSDAGFVSPDDVALTGLAFDALGAASGTAVTIQRSPSPRSHHVLRTKIRGDALAEDDIRLVVRDLIEGRYSPAETAGFLVAACRNLSFDEVVALTRVRAEHMKRLVWDGDLVVDKHSMGGTPGSRITLIVVPIVAAHGLIIPKTSSRAITSAAGTADAMEVLARVDLTQADMQRVVAACRGCIAWNGRINHSPVDDVMNAINRPLGLSSRLLDVSSILSKKLAAGSSHVLIDIPYGTDAKIKDWADARELADLFERVGAAVGLTVIGRPSEGSAPIGRGVGPALEVRDVLQVLSGDPGAPADLRDKAIAYAGQILEWDPALHGASGTERARGLLASGAARAAFEAIATAQGRQPIAAAPGSYVREVVAARAGVIEGFRGYIISGLARAAGAPSDKAAGVDILAALGDTVRAGQPLLRVHASQDAALARAFNEHAAQDAVVLR